MKALILAAGYATRLYPLTKNFPKPLLEVGGKTVLDHLLEQLKTISEIDEIYLVTNAKYVQKFQEWKEKNKVDISIINDNTIENEERLGAIGDIQFAIEQENIADDLLVSASDNIFQFNILDFVATYKKNPKASICVREIEDVEDRKKRGIVELDEGDKVIGFQEKPEKPLSKFAAPPMYLYPEATLPRIKEYLDAGENSDAPGYFIEWLYRKEEVYAHKIDGTVMDIGNKESLDLARKELKS
jgi:glucose-1-phosphate thymidylyltransferase